jgi:hypothetical protein
MFENLIKFLKNTPKKVAYLIHGGNLTKIMTFLTLITQFEAKIVNF